MALAVFFFGSRLRSYGHRDGEQLHVSMVVAATSSTYILDSSK
jgi:hypothetical protein